MKGLSSLSLVFFFLISAGSQAHAEETIAPHKAIYKVTLAKAKSTVGLSDVKGTMSFDLADADDGWTVHQHMQMQFTYPEGDVSDVLSSVVTWEAKNGESFVFHAKRLSSTQPESAFKGRATLGPMGGIAQYTFPEDKKEVMIPTGAIFPVAHTRLILQKAIAGEKLVDRRVFDGTDEEGSADVNAFIGSLVQDNTVAAAGVGEELLSHCLLEDQKVWPVRLAFYEPASQASEPEYEMQLMMQENGIARSMVIDYGDFSINGTLAKIETHGAEACAEATKK